MNLASVLRAEDSAVDFGGLPEALSSALGLPLAASQILVSVLLVLVVLLVVAIFTKDKLTLIIFVLLALTVDIALGWLSYFVLVFACLIVALLYASAMRKMLSGG